MLVTIICLHLGFIRCGQYRTSWVKIHVSVVDKQAHSCHMHMVSKDDVFGDVVTQQAHVDAGCIMWTVKIAHGYFLWQSPPSPEHIRWLLLDPEERKVMKWGVLTPRFISPGWDIMQRSREHLPSAKLVRLRWERRMEEQSKADKTCYSLVVSFSPEQHSFRLDQSQQCKILRPSWQVKRESKNEDVFFFYVLNLTSF